VRGHAGLRRRSHSGGQVGAVLTIGISGRSDIRTRGSTRLHSQCVTWEFIDIPAPRSLLQPRQLVAFMGLGSRSDSKEGAAVVCGVESHRIKTILVLIYER
jgi:hypothetical protein